MDQLHLFRVFVAVVDANGFAGAARKLQQRGVPQRPEDLAAHDIVSASAVASGAEWRLVKDGAPCVVKLQPGMSSTTSDAALATAGFPQQDGGSCSAPATARRAGLPGGSSSATAHCCAGVWQPVWSKASCLRIPTSQVRKGDRLAKLARRSGAASTVAEPASSAHAGLRSSRRAMRIHIGCAAGTWWLKFTAWQSK